MILCDDVYEKDTSVLSNVSPSHFLLLITPYLRSVAPFYYLLTDKMLINIKNKEKKLVSVFMSTSVFYALNKAEKPFLTHVMTK